MPETTTQKNEDLIRNIETVRKNYDLHQLSSQIQKRGDLNESSKILGISYSALKRAMIETKFLPRFLNLDKSKAQLLTYFKMERELELFQKSYNLYKLPFRTLKIKIKEFHKSLSKNPLLLLTQEQHDILIGSGLGDGNFRDRNNKNCSFRIGHSKKQENYLGWKFERLKEFTSNGVNIAHKNIKGNNIEIFQFSTFTHPVFNFYYNLFYHNNRKIVTSVLLNQLTERSLAIWICDDGSYCKSLKYIVICTNSFSLEEHNLIKDFFNKRWGLNPTIGFRDKKYYYLRFTVKDTKKLVQLIEPFIPVKEMLYKVGN